MNKLAETWSRFSTELVEGVDRIVNFGEQPNAWRKAPDNTPVSDYDILIDLELRRCFFKWFADADLLSEELGWTRAQSRDHRSGIVGVVDPIDGTESLLKGAGSWWVSFGVLVHGEATFGVLHQPSTGATFDSLSVDVADTDRQMVVGVSPDQAEDEALVARLTSAGFRVMATPHSAEKLAAVLQGRCSSAAFIPSAKSPAWHSWDLAAGIAVAKRAGLLLTDVDGEMLRLEDLDRPRAEPWICARERAEHRALAGLLRHRDAW